MVRMAYMRSWNYIFENPNWMMNVLWMGLCFLSTTIIPVAGQLLVVGYLFEIIEAIHTRRTATYPDFTLEGNKLVEYLLRGLWVFLVQLVLALVLLPLIFGGFALAALVVGLIGAGGGEEAAGIAMLVVMPVALLGVFAAAVALNLFMVPIVLRAGLTQDFGQAFRWSFAKQFVSLTWMEMIVSALFLIAAGLAAELVGLLACCIGIFFTLSLVFLMQAHLGLQLYELHLARGGEAIPLKPSKPGAAW